MAKKKTGAKAAGRIYIGIGGWTFEPWRGVFYPEGLVQRRELEFASRALTFIATSVHTNVGVDMPTGMGECQRIAPCRSGAQITEAIA